MITKLIRLQILPKMLFINLSFSNYYIDYISIIDATEGSNMQLNGKHQLGGRHIDGAGVKQSSSSLAAKIRSIFGR